MRIERQIADSIYNIEGDMHLHQTEEVTNQLKEQQQNKLRQLHSTSFLEVLNQSYSKKKIIKRDNELKKIKELLSEEKQIIIQGEPGIGKTTSLFQLAQAFDNVIYLSIKDRSPVSTLSYLINKIRLSKNEELVEISDLEQGLNWLESSLQKSDHYFIIDDCEQNQGTVQSVINLEKFQSKFIFGTRNRMPFKTSGIRVHSCTPFEENEIQQFLKAHAIELPTLDFHHLVRASAGNPLYLFYYAIFRTSPLPDSLAAYQDAIWGGLTEKQREILIYVSLPYFHLKLTELSEILDLDSPLSSLSAVEELSDLVRNSEGELEIFHPSFEEFIFQSLTQTGLMSHYQKQLGEFYLQKKEIVQATYLLIDAAPDLIEDYLFEVFPNLIRWGELRLAIKVMEIALNSVDEDLEKGYLSYHLSSVHHLLGKKEEAESLIDHAIQHLKTSGNQQFLLASRMYKAIYLVNKGQVNEALDIADKVFNSLPKEEASFRAPLLVNLSKIYVDLSEFRKGAEICKEAFELFQKKEDRDGMTASLVNLTTCLSQMDDSRELAEEYSLHLLDILDDKDFLIEVIVLSTLASIYREKEQYEEAIKYSKKAISLCQTYELKDKIVLNLVNYGNIVRDSGNIPEARMIYDEALEVATDTEQKKELGRIYWILSSMDRKEGKLDSSLDYANKAINTNKNINFYYGVANACRVKAKTLLTMGKSIEAAEAFIESAEYYAKMEQYSWSYQENLSKAIKIYYREGSPQKARYLLKSLLSNTAKQLDYQELAKLMMEEESETSLIPSYYNRLFKAIFSNKENTENPLFLVLTLIDYCQNLDTDQGKKVFKEVLYNMISNLGQSSFAYSLAGIAIEQSGALLQLSDMPDIADKLRGKLSLFSFREINDEFLFITSVANSINLEIHTFYDEPTCQKLALSLVLLLHESPELIIDGSSFLESKCEVWIHNYGPEMKRVLGKYIEDKGTPFSKHIQSIHGEKTSYHIQEMIIVNTDYEKYASLNSPMDNKTSLYFFLNTIMGLKSHFHHKSLRSDKTERRRIMHKTAWLYGYSNTDLNSDQMVSEFSLDLHSLISSSVRNV